MTYEQSTDGRRDIHTNRQIAVAKGGAMAVTVLNSGSWLALLSQVSNLEGYNTGLPVFLWGIGALLGTIIWLYIYRGTTLKENHEFNPENQKISAKIAINSKCGFRVAIASLGCFGLGVLVLTGVLSCPNMTLWDIGEWLPSLWNRIWV